MPKSRKATTSIECHLISVATGNFAWQIIKAVATQFPSVKVDLIAHSFVDSTPRLESVLKELKGKNVWVFHALMDPDSKRVVEQYCQRYKIPAYDIGGGVIQFFMEHSGKQPQRDPIIDLDEGYFRRLDALEFTLQHDDSRRLESLPDANIILVGLSRVSKTPTSCYLGSMGFRVANVSIVPEHGLPAALKRANVKKKIVALTIQPKQLQQIRARRMAVNRFDKVITNANNQDDFSYINLKRIIREVMDAESIYRTRKFKVVDITDQTVEVTATMVLETLGLQRPFN